MKRSQIILEGPDCSGKTTQFKRVWSKIQADNNYQLLLNDRGLMSILAYGMAENRFKNVEDIKDEFLEYLNKNIIIYFTIELEVLKGRFDKRGDERQEWDDIEKVWKIYEKLKKEFTAHPNFNIVESDQSMDDIEFEIGHIIERYINKPYYYTISDAATVLRHFGKREDTTQELINYEVDLNLSHDDIFEILNETQLTGLEQIVGKFEQLEKDSYKFQYAKFKKKIETILSGYYGKLEDIKSRKFVFTDDECLSYYHILCRNNILYVNVHFRSSNIDLFRHDFLSICEMIKIFYKKLEVKYKVKLNIKFDSLHKYV
jgi:thymidylate kinase